MRSGEKGYWVFQLSMNMNLLPNNEKTIGDAVGSIKWATLAEGFSRASTPILYLVLASLLNPDDFGIISASFIVINFSQIIWDSGLSRSIVQTDLPVDAVANVIFWTNLFLSLPIYIFICLYSIPLSNFLNVPEVAAVLPFIGIQIIFRSLVSVPQAVLARNFEYKSILLAKLSNSLIPIMIALPLALLNFGVWSLVIGYLSGSILNTIVYWYVCDWKPTIRIQWKYLSEIKKFGFWSLSEGFSAWFFSWGDNLLVGKFLGSYNLGVYSIGWNVVSMTFGLILNPLQTVFYSMVSRLKNNVNLIRATYQKILGYLLFLTFPIAISFFFVTDLLIPEWVTNRWNGLGLVIAMIGLLYGFSSLTSINPDLFRGFGQPIIGAKVMWIAIGFYLPVYLIVIPMGIKPFLIARLILGISTLPIQYFYVNKLIFFRILDYLTTYWWILISLLVMIITMISGKYLLFANMNNLIHGIVILGVSFVLYLVITLFWHPEFLRDIAKDIGFRAKSNQAD